MQLYFDSTGGQAYCSQCALGTFKDLEGVGSCQDCPKGSKCPDQTASELRTFTYKLCTSWEMNYKQTNSL